MVKSHRHAVISCLKVDKRTLGEAGPVSLRVVDGPIHGPQLEAFGRPEQSGEFAVDEGRELHPTFRLEDSSLRLRKH